jgi:polyhydroxybutyrate depolymerase
MALDPDTWETMTNFNPLADKEGFIVAYPQGGASAETLSAVLPLVPEAWFTGGYTWNAGSCCPGASRQKIDDVQFTRDLVAILKGGAIKKLSGGAFDVDPGRIYAAGGSNGAFMNFRLACQAPDLFAAIAPVAAVLANELRDPSQLSRWPSDPFDCPKPSKPVPMLITHGTADSITPWGGRAWMNFKSVEDNLNGMKAFNGIPEDAHGAETYNHRNAKCTSYGNMDSNVTFCRVDKMGHCWPTDTEEGSQCSSSVDLTVQAWEFFRRYRLTTDTNRTTNPPFEWSELVSCSARTSLQPLTLICFLVFFFHRSTL